MQFNALVEEVQGLSREEKLEIRGLLDRYLAEEERQRFARSYQESLVELREGRLDFTDDIGPLQQRCLDSWPHSNMS